MKVKLDIILLVLLFSAGSGIFLAQQQPILVTGRAVDERGLPIAGAIVSLFAPPCRNCIDNVGPSTVSLPDGVFILDSEGVSTKGLKLYISERVTKGFWALDGGP